MSAKVFSLLPFNSLSQEEIPRGLQTMSVTNLPVRRSHAWNVAFFYTSTLPACNNVVFPEGNIEAANVRTPTSTIELP